MKLCRYGPVDRETPGLVDADGRLRDLSGVIADRRTIVAFEPATRA